MSKRRLSTCTIVPGSPSSIVGPLTICVAGLYYAYTMLQRGAFSTEISQKHFGTSNELMSPTTHGICITNIPPMAVVTINATGWLLSIASLIIYSFIQYLKPLKQ